MAYQGVHTHPIVIVIATSMRRTRLLINRSLNSVYTQKNVNPLKTYIVDDNERMSPDDDISTEYYDIKTRVEESRTESLSERHRRGLNEIPDDYYSTEVVPNTRTHGNSGTGAWNTGAHLADELGKERLFLAFLDDDDEWNENYLSSCYEEISKNEKLVAVFPSFMRLGKEEDELTIMKKEDLTQRVFFETNPGVQSSNMFIELETFMDIGGFDENMPSTTDRDLCIRLIDHIDSADGEKEVGTIEECLMLHHAYDDNRVTADREKKRRGLDIFYKKYRDRMTDSVFARSLARARKLFGYEYSSHHE